MLNYVFIKQISRINPLEKMLRKNPLKDKWIVRVKFFTKDDLYLELADLLMDGEASDSPIAGTS